ncbi:MAG: hypothetical protein GBAus27B_000473 [Mycoplasmataceae bacterium]|nr:MAG: hypothetical protein GBAus27B_000473 [Mycoplasmataceae bacterium]
MKEIDLLINNRKIFFLIILVFSFFFIILSTWKKEKKLNDKKFLFCPVRGFLRSKKYDVSGNYTEEYQRIKLIKYLLKKGHNKNQFIIEHSIRIGHKGHNILRVDLAIKKNGKFFLVAEVKKKYTIESMKSAIHHQLLPALRLVDAKYGIYFDGTKNSRLLIKNPDGVISIKNFP